MSSRWFFAFFAISGLCSLIDEVVWLRLAMAAFGVTTPMVSLVLSLFMAGLGLGSALSGRIIDKWLPESQGAQQPLRAYGLVEGLISVSSLLVPFGFVQGSALLGWLGTSWASGLHYVGAGLVLTVTMLPFGVCMGTTIPLAMTAMRRLYGPSAQRSFSYLYLANLIGAALGTLGSAFVLIELFGFRKTLLIAGSLNLLLCVAALLLSRRRALAEPAVQKDATAQPDSPALEDPRAPGLTLLWLCLTGLSSMAMEVVWTRLFLPYVGTLVYAFAAILAIYLGTTFVGSQLYRLWAARQSRVDSSHWLWVVACTALLSLLPLAAADPRFAKPGFLHGLFQVAVGIGPFCASLGFLTPLFVDRYGRGQARRVGVGYAVNVVGCILGPLLAGFLLLPQLTERSALLLLAAPLFLTALYTIAREPSGTGLRRAAGVLCLGSLLPGLGLVLLPRSAVDRFPAPKIERRDYTATTVAWGSGMDKHITVNGVGMTSLTPITKMMVHLPLAMLSQPPQSALVICFGMGTSYRSALSWGIQVTAVELVPSVPELIGFFHPDGDAVLKAKNGRVVIDDGRRFLAREGQKFDVIIIDPPPPVAAAGSSLLYTTELYREARRRLAPAGILQQWIPVADAATLSAVARALQASFPQVRVYSSVEGWGYHLLGSAVPLPDQATAQQLAARLPEAARRDLIEWNPQLSPAQMIQGVLSRPMALPLLIRLANVPALQDDRPINEYYLLRTGHF